VNGVIFVFSLQQKQFARSINIRQLIGEIRPFQHWFAHVGSAVAQNAEAYARCTAPLHRDASGKVDRKHHPLN
jgi:hypothetical protein